ncbi:MAG: AMP-dependent synthetase/ligase [Brooklawnia sp.]|jgi:long-chain acyl-CoA synthetase
MTATAQQIAEQILADCPPNYPTMFRDRVAADPGAIAFTVPEAEGWRDVSWAEVRRVADQAAAGLIGLGLEPEQRVAIACSTRLEWIEADLGIASAAGATTTIYPNTHAEEVLHIVVDSGSQVLVVEDAEQLAKCQKLPALHDRLTRIILIDDDRPADAPHDERVLTWDELLVLGSTKLADDPECVDRAIATIGPDSLSTLIYTSGTTGQPKGVRLPHRAWTYEGMAVKHLNIVRPDDVLYLWLPLSHVFGRDLLACQLALGFRSVVDGRVDRIVEGLGQTHPTILVGVPRIFEKVRSAVVTMYPRSGLKGRISRWAFRVGRQSRPYRLAGRKLPRLLAMQYSVADRLVFSKLKQRLGGRMRYMISGSAKLSHRVQEWFYSAGITVVEGYGATETAAIASVNVPFQPRFGTVGPALPGLEIKIAEDGEVLIKGPSVANGYHNLPEETAEAFVDGWYYTGDIGTLDAEGYLTITDRKKDLFKTSGGKFVPPQKVENAVMASIPYVSQVVAIGDGRKFVSALLALDPATLQKWAERRGRDDLSYEELTQLPEIRASIDRMMRKANSHLDRWEQIKRYTILDSELTLAEGTLTPSLKVRRAEVNKEYTAQIEAMYEDGELSDLEAE